MLKSRPNLIPHKPSEFPVLGAMGAEDFADILAGRVLRSFGAIDRWLYHAIHQVHTEQVLRAPVMLPRILTHDTRPELSQRFQTLRQLISQASSNNSKVLSEYDRLQKQARELGEIRHHLAHGQWHLYVAEGELGVEIADSSTWHRWKLKAERIHERMRSTGDHSEYHKHLQIRTIHRYTFIELEQARADIVDLELRLKNFQASLYRSLNWTK